MASEETMKSILRMLVQAYPERFKLAADTLPIWHRLLLDIPDVNLMAAAIRHVTENKWPPSVAELRNAAFDAVEPERLTAGEAWQQVCRNIRRFGFYAQQEAKAAMPPLLWRCVESLGGYDYLCRSEEPMADRAHFIRIYEQIAERERQTARMLPEVRELRARLAAGQVQYLGTGDE